MKYFDHAASTYLYPEVLEVMAHAQREDFANPGALHVLGYEIKEKIERARADFLKNLGAPKNGTFVFTSSATESNNTVVRGLNLNEGDVILYSKADHASLTSPAERRGVTLREIPHLPDGSIGLEAFTRLLDDKVKLVLISHVNNQSGVESDLFLIAKLIKEKTKAHLHVDAVQSFGKIKLQLSPEIDSLSLSAHKIGGPKGIAGLYLKKADLVEPLMFGGGQENNLRSSTESWPLIAGFQKAMKLSVIEKAVTVSGYHETVKRVLQEKIPGIQFPFQKTSPYILSFIIPGIPADVLLRHLEMREVYVSTTSACSSRISGFNPTLAALQIHEKHHKHFMRISFGPLTTREEVNELNKHFIEVWESVCNLIS